MRSAKVPESPSSALQTMYLRVAPWRSATVFHLMPVGKARAAAAAQARRVTSSTIAAGASARARFEPA